MKFALFVALSGFVAALSLQAATGFAVEKTDSESWSKILGAVGIAESTRPQASIVIAGESANEDVAKLADDHILVLIGNGAATEKFGFKARPTRCAFDRFGICTHRRCRLSGSGQ